MASLACEKFRGEVPAAVAPDPLHAFEVALPAVGPGGGAGGSVRVRVALHRYQLDLRFELWAQPDGTLYLSDLEPYEVMDEFVYFAARSLGRLGNVSEEAKSLVASIDEQRRAMLPSVDDFIESLLLGGVNTEEE